MRAKKENTHGYKSKENVVISSLSSFSASKAAIRHDDKKINIVISSWNIVIHDFLTEIASTNNRLRCCTTRGKVFFIREWGKGIQGNTCCLPSILYGRVVLVPARGNFPASSARKADVAT